MDTGIQRAVQEAGGQSALARMLTQRGRKVTPQAVQKWVTQGFAPAGRCREIEEVLDGKVTRADLNPLIFGAPSDAH